MVLARRIVVPLDGSELAGRALPAAEELARLIGAPLHLVRVADVTRLERYNVFGMGLEAAAFTQLLDEEEQAARDYLAKQQRRLAEAGLTVSTEVRRGSVVRELVDLTKPDDLVVMASHGRGGLARWFLGSVAEEMIRRAPAPVLLVRAAPAAAAQPPAGERPSAGGSGA